MDAFTIVAVIGLATLVVERIATWSMKIKRSKCFGNEIEMRESNI